jgi:hypothetical protein
MMVSFIDAMTATFGGCATGTEPVAAAWNQPIHKTGRKPSVNCVKGCKPETTTRCISSGRASSSLLGEWADFFLENYSKPPIRSISTHEANENALKSLRAAFGPMKMTEIDAIQIEIHLPSRLRQRKHVRRREGIAHLGVLKPTTMHQEFRVLRRIFNVAVKKKRCPANPC